MITLLLDVMDSIALQIKNSSLDFEDDRRDKRFYIAHLWSCLLTP